MAEQPCPICDTPMHPTMRDCYGHCGGEYCEGWTDSRDVYVEPEDPHAAAFGCTGVGEGDEADDDALCVDRVQRLFILHSWRHVDGREANSFLAVGYKGQPRCTATDAHRAEQETV